jgi:hypothetical protein
MSRIERRRGMERGKEDDFGGGEAPAELQTDSRMLRSTERIRIK